MRYPLTSSSKALLVAKSWINCNNAYERVSYVVFQYRGAYAYSVYKN